MAALQLTVCTLQQCCHYFLSNPCIMASGKKYLSYLTGANNYCKIIKLGLVLKYSHGKEFSCALTTPRSHLLCVAFISYLHPHLILVIVPSIIINHTNKIVTLDRWSIVSEGNSIHSLLYSVTAIKLKTSSNFPNQNCKSYCNHRN